MGGTGKGVQGCPRASGNRIRMCTPVRCLRVSWVLTWVLNHNLHWLSERKGERVNGVRHTTRTAVHVFNTTRTLPGLSSDPQGPSTHRSRYHYLPAPRTHHGPSARRPVGRWCLSHSAATIELHKPRERDTFMMVRVVVHSS